MKFDIITIGSSTIDEFIYTDNIIVKKKVKSSIKELLAYPLGSKILIKKIIEETGGGGTNTAATFAKMDLKVGWLGIVGDDSNGKKILDEMKKKEITFLGKVKKGMSGYSIILDSYGHERTVLTHKGVNDNLLPADVPRLDTKWIYLSSMMNQSFLTVRGILKNSKAKIAFNPSSYLVKKGKKYLSPILTKTEVLILNEEEAMILSKKKNLKLMALDLYKTGPRIIVITRGHKGLFCFDGTNYYEQKANKVKVIESLGAGDAFASGFVSALIKGLDVSHSLQIGLANAQSEIQQLGAKEGILSFSEAQRLAKKQQKVQRT